MLTSILSVPFGIDIAKWKTSENKPEKKIIKVHPISEQHHLEVEVEERRKYNQKKNKQTGKKNTYATPVSPANIN